MPHFRLLLFGGFEATLDGEPITAFGVDKARALLAYLALERAHPHRREELAALLWPDSPSDKAAHNLSQTLLRLRRALGETQGKASASRQPLLLVSSQELQFNPLSDHWLDVAQFGELIRAQRQHRHPSGAACPTCIGWLDRAVSLYRGELLAGLAVRDSVPFEEWQLMQQEGLHIQAVEALNLLASYYGQCGEPQRVHEYARRIVLLEPWHEPAQLKLVSALAASGQTGAALEQYGAYSRLLAAEFGATPSAEANALLAQVQAQHIGKPTRRPPQGYSSQGALPSGDQPQPAPDERRQVTVLVCGRRHAFGAWGREDDVEGLGACSATCDATLARYGGRRQVRQGPDCLVYFGHPLAYEDAAHCAVQAGLALAAASTDEHAYTIGVHTGMMASLRGETVGHAPALARTCQQHAEPGSVWVTADTERLIRGWFDCQLAGQLSTPGSLDPVQVYRVNGESSLANRLAWLAQHRRLAPLVGREPEMHKLTACLQAAQQGQGQIVTLCGEAGLGKSRLLWELRRLGSPFVLWLESSCSPRLQHTSLHPLAHVLEQLLAFQPGDDGRARRNKLDRLLQRLDFTGPATAWLLSLLLDLPAETPAPEIITEDQRQRMREAWVALLGRLAAQQPVALVIEDLHWADPSTIAWLDASLDALTATGCLTLLTYRPSFTPTWRPRSRLTSLNLGPLNAGQIERMVDALLGDTMAPAELRRRVIERADGVPLFAEELARSLAEGNATTDDNAIPATLRDSLHALLDRVGAAKVTAGWAAAIGREFSYPVLAAVTPFDEARLQADLVTLAAAGLIQPVADPAEASYCFRHALIHEAAYAALLKPTRQAYHRRIAETYARCFPQLADALPQVMADHSYQAGLADYAVDHWLKAGEHANARGATVEARRLFERALATIGPEDGERRWRALWGYEAALNAQAERPAQKAAVDALLALAEDLDDDTRRAQAQLRRARFASSQANYREQAQAADAACAAAPRGRALAIELEALAYKVTALLRLGQSQSLPPVVAETLSLAQAVNEEAIRSYAMAAVALYYFENGELARAARTLTQSLEAARRAPHRQLDLESQYHGHLGLAYTQLGLYAEARDVLEAGLKLTNLTGIGRYRAYQMLHLGYVYWRTGDLDAAFQMEEAALQEYLATGEAFGQAACLAYLGNIHAEAGRLESAARYLAQAREACAQLGVEPDRIEAQVGLARALAALGQHEAARQLTLEVWQYLCEQGTTGFTSPSWAYACVADVLDRVEIPGIAVEAVFEKGYHELMQRASQIDNSAWRQAFLYNVAENRAIVERWQR